MHTMYMIASFLLHFAYLLHYTTLCNALACIVFWLQHKQSFWVAAGR